MIIQQIQNQIMGTYGIYGTYTIEACPLFNEKDKKLFLQIPFLGSGVAGLNIALEFPAMIMSRHIIFDAVISIISKSIFGGKR